MTKVSVLARNTPEGETVIVRWFDRAGQIAPVDLIVWPGGGFVRTFAGFRVAATRETLHLFEAGQA